MLAATDREALRRALGADGVEEHEPIEIQGQRIDVSLHPAAGPALAAGIRVLGERGLAALVVGGGSRLELGNLPRPAQVLLSTRALAGVDELDGEEGVVHARAGTRLTELEDRARAAGWELPLDPPGEGSTLGGTLAAAAIGPRHLGFGRPRDAALGLEVVLGDGVRTRCGGRVVKNVTGYDLMKLHVGAFGSLGVIEAAWLRLRPPPETARVTCWAVGSLEAALERGLEAARLTSARAVVVVDARLGATGEHSAALRAGYLLVAELAGDEPVVTRDTRALEQMLGVGTPSPGALARLRALQVTDTASGSVRFRIAVRPSRLGFAAGPLLSAGAALVAHPGTGLLFAHFALEREVDEVGADRAWRASQAAAAAGDGTCVAELAPGWAKQARDVFGARHERLPLLRALKHRFDPAGVLNPGRFAGGL